MAETVYSSPQAAMYSVLHGQLVDQEVTMTALVYLPSSSQPSKYTQSNGIHGIGYKNTASVHDP